MAEKKRRWKNFYKENTKSSVVLYFVLRILVIIIMIARLIEGDFSSAFLCLLTLILFMIPFWVNDKSNIAIPDTMQIIILLFIFSAEILGEINNFYVRIPNWDVILHVINGFISAAIGFSLIDILNDSTRLHIHLSPAFVAIVAICFSITIGVVWEFVEYGADHILKLDMQKDKIVQTVSSVMLEEDDRTSKPVVIEDIDKTVIYTTDGEETVIEGGYLDIGINDTMKDLMVDFVGAVLFAILGFLYIRNEDKYKITENFMPKKKVTKKQKEVLEKDKDKDVKESKKKK